ncbi:fructokinase [Ancylobacter vacuolatus]|uniref:Fructokinase n=1 Tax=Ancylobacter vacuolatus TaxID=223389 RepID=A0ABU0DHW7_9HYPH|nr:carbohydrate kinase [Ancylobacter vacuolatus]MDQ0348019.1 fructokinase [Ancylobacter vacuolatus]
MSAPAKPAAPVLLCAGEALIDMVPRPTPEGQAFLPLPGGAVFNTAIAAARLGVSTRFWYGLSSDMFGVQLRAALDAAGADASLCPPIDRPSTLAFVTLAEGQARYLFLDENTAGRMLTPADLPNLPDEVGVLFFGGLSLVNEPVGSAMEALAARTAVDGHGRLIMLDPNIRPGFIRHEATYRARLFRLIGLSHVVKLSDEDLFWLTGPGEIATQAERIRAMGPRLVLITLGAKGARAFGEGLDVAVPGQAVTVADTVGAGDTFNAAFLCALVERELATPQALSEMSEAVLGASLDFASRAAAISVTRAGANPPWRNEVAAG